MPVGCYPAEAFYVLDGVVTFRVGSRSFTAQAGAFVLVPPGALHTFANHHAMPARFLLLVSPAEFVNYFDELAKAAPPDRQGSATPSTTNDFAIVYVGPSRDNQPIRLSNPDGSNDRLPLANLSQHGTPAWPWRTQYECL